jgi:hypothetical protein
MRNWEISTLEGRYVGRSTAHSAELAFSQCMVVFGRSVDLGDVSAEQLMDGTCRLVYRGETYIARIA